MYVLIELWKARPPWHELGSARREEYLATVIPAIDQLLSDGVELVSPRLGPSNVGALAFGRSLRRGTPGGDGSRFAPAMGSPTAPFSQ